MNKGRDSVRGLDPLDTFVRSIIISALKIHHRIDIVQKISRSQTSIHIC